MNHHHMDHFAIASDLPPLPHRIQAKAENEIVCRFLAVLVQKNVLTVKC